MPTTTTNNDLFVTLTNLGVLVQDAQVLSDAYPNVSNNEFIAGIDQIARILLSIELPGLAPSICEPWLTIHNGMIGAVDVTQAYANACMQLQPITVQQAAIGAVSARLQSISSQQGQQQNKIRKSIEYMNAYASLGYSLRLNLCADVVEINGKPITEPQRAIIRNQMRDAGFHNMQAVDDALLAEAFRNAYHPVREYLNALAYDGGQHIAKLASYFIDDRGIFPIFLRKWLIGSVAKIMNKEFNPMLVIDGAQNLGKSHFASWLCPIEEYFLESSISPDNEDHQRRMMDTWIWEVAELGSTTRKADRDALKSFISLRDVRIRKKYDRYDTVKPSMASFIGTVNNDVGFLSDPTGSRRFWVCHIVDINWDYAKEIDVNQIWAEAYIAFRAGEVHTLTPEEKLIMLEINEHYQIDDPLEGKILKYFRVEPNNKLLWTATSDILDVLEDPFKGALKGTTKANAMALASTMTKLGLEKRKGYNARNQRVWGYVGIDNLSNLP